MTSRSVSPFLPGLALSRRFYAEAVRPLLDEAAPGLAHSAGLLGSGSEVLGFDTARSADHEWGPRVLLFLPAEEIERRGADLRELLSARLPKTFAGRPTHFAATAEPGIRVMAETDGPVRHRVECMDPGHWFEALLGFDPRAGVTRDDWLSTPTQRLAEATGGAVFHDGLGVLGPVRERLEWYPYEIWLHLLGCQWRRVAQEEAFVGRCGEVGDELGAAVVAARLVRELMRLCLLMNRRYPPYSKWLGSAFARTPQAPDLTPVLRAALAATDRHERERQLARAYERVAALHNSLGLTEPLDPTTRPYHSRPFQVLRADRFATALSARITDPDLRALPPSGGVDQFVDSTEVLNSPGAARAVTRAADQALR